MCYVDAMSASDVDAGQTLTTPEPTEGQASDLPGDPAQSSEDSLDQWLGLATTGQHSATATLLKFVDTVDKLVPLGSVGPVKRRQVITAGLEMTQRLIHAPFGAGRSFVQSAVLVNVNVDVDVASRHQTT